MEPLSLRTEDLLRLLALQGGREGVVGERLRWLLDFAQHGSVSRTCRRFNIARTTFYRWARRFDPANISTLSDLPTRPDLVLAPGPAKYDPLPSDHAPPGSPGDIPFTHAVPAATRPPHDCWLCTVRGWNWGYVRRSLLTASILSNLAFGALLLASAISESRTENVSASVLRDPDTASSSDFDPHP